MNISYFKLKIIVITFLILFYSCDESKHLSNEIKKSIIQEYPLININLVEFMDKTRSIAFKELNKKGELLNETKTLYLIESVDITNWYIRGVIINGNKYFYYIGNYHYKKITMDTKPNVRQSYINSYINNNFNDLSDSTRLVSSLIYFGITVKMGDTLKISHYKW